MKPDSSKKKTVITILLLTLAAVLILPFPALSKYTSEFSKTVDFMISPPEAVGDGIPTDGAVTNDTLLCLPPGTSVPVGTSSEAGYSLSTRSETAYSMSTYSEAVYPLSTVSETR